MHSVKKILSPVLYPTSKAMDKTWFIKYKSPDYRTGSLVSKKYKGALNLEPDFKKRLAMANEYLAIMENGELPPNVKGIRYIPATGYKESFASIIVVCEEWLHGRRHEIEYKTVKDYRCKVKRLTSWLSDNDMPGVGVGAITRDIAKRFLLHLKDEGLSNKTYNDYKILFGSIWADLIADEKLTKNPWRAIDCLPDEVEHFASFPADVRDKIRLHLPSYDLQLWIYVLCIYYCGMRPKEARFLKIEHLLFDTQCFNIPKEIAKGTRRKKKGRIVNVHDELFRLLLLHGYDKYASDFYVFGRNGKPGECITPDNYFRVKWNAFRLTYKIPERYKLYSGKHTSGKLISKKFGAYVAKEHFGHSTIQSTEHYIDNLDKKELSILQSGIPSF